MNNVVVFGPVQSGKSTLMGYLASAFMSDRTFALEAYEVEKRIAKLGIQQIKDELILPGFLALDRDELIDQKNENAIGTTKRIHRKKVYLELDSSFSSSRFIFIDTPGFRVRDDSTRTSRSRKTIQYRSEHYGFMFEGDIGLYVISSLDIQQYLSLKSSDYSKRRIEERRLFSPLEFWCEYKGAKKLIVILTKTDYFLNKQSELENIYCELTRFVEHYAKQQVAIVPTSIRLGYQDDVVFRIDRNIRSKDEALTWYRGDTLLSELKKHLKSQETATTKPFRIAAAKQIRKIPNSSNIALRVQCVYGDLETHQKLVLGPVLDDAKNKVFLQATVRSLKIEDGEVTNQLPEGMIGGVAFKTLNNLGSKNATASLSDYRLTPTTVLLSGPYCTGNVLCIRIKEDELSERMNIALLQLLPKEQARFYWMGKPMTADVIELYRKGGYLHISLANLTDIFNSEENCIALPACLPSDSFDLECLASLRYVQYFLKDEGYREVRNAHALFHVTEIKDINSRELFDIKLYIDKDAIEYDSFVQATNSCFNSNEKTYVDSTKAVVAINNVHMRELQDIYRKLRAFAKSEGIYSFELRFSITNNDNRTQSAK